MLAASRRHCRPVSGKGRGVESARRATETDPRPALFPYDVDQQLFGDVRTSYYMSTQDGALRAHEAIFLTPPVEYPWAIRAFFEDPDGHLIEISEGGEYTPGPQTDPAARLHCPDSPHHVSSSRFGPGRGR